MKNAYAQKLIEKKQQERLEIFRDAVEQTTDFLQQIFTLALNKEGFGRDRINRVSGYVNDYIDHYRRLQADDPEYADAKLRAANDKIMRE